jgi:hypothetical protein
VTALALGFSHSTDTEAGVHCLWLTNDQTIFDQFADCLAWHHEELMKKSIKSKINIKRNVEMKQ